MEIFSKKEAIRFGWESMKSHFGFWIGILLVVMIINAAANYFVVLPLLVSPILQMGLQRIAIKLVDAQKPNFKDLFTPLTWQLFINYILGTFLYSLIVIAGFLLLVVPGIIWAIKFQFVGYLIVDKGMKAMEALRQSAQMTKGVKWDLFFFNLLLLLINLAGALVFLIGLFATIPATMVATAFVYRKLLK